MPELSGQVAAACEPLRDTALLSCITTGLAAYLREEQPGIEVELARGVRLAVTADQPVPAFSHHRRSLAALPDGGRLLVRRAEHPDQVVAGLESELRGAGRALVVAESGALPWAPGFGRESAAHLVLVDDRRPGGWHVRDPFDALLPAGRQVPFEGWVDDQVLVRFLSPTSGRSAAARQRERYLFGFPEAGEGEGPLAWLVRRAGEPTGSLPGDWRGGGAALAWLSDWFATEGPANEGVAVEDSYQDVWAAARHHEHRFRVLAQAGDLDPGTADAAAEAWRQLTRALRFALDSAARGRPRPSLIEQSFEAALSRLAELGVCGTSEEEL